MAEMSDLYDKPCKEIFKLKRMLEKADIPFEFIEGFGYDPNHICYPNKDNMRISVIEGFGTHGREQDRLEILGGFTPWEQFKHGDSPIGFLTAKNVFKRIKKDYDEISDREGWML